MSTIIRAQVAHTPRDPFLSEGALEVFDDGAVAFADGRIVACGAYRDVRAGHSGADVFDAREDILLPGFVDAHVHYPQIRVIAAMGLELLDWLRLRSLPEETRLADDGYAHEVADRFVRGLARNGTTTALVFGSHFPRAQEVLFEAADAAGLRLFSGLVVSDRGLVPDLEVAVETAVELSRALIERWHGRGLTRYAVMPRFAISCSEELRATIWRLMSAMALCGKTPCSRITSTSQTTSFAGWRRPTPPSPPARRATRSSVVACFRCAAISTAGCGSRSVPMSAPGPD